MWNGLYSYSPLTSLAFVPFNAMVARFGTLIDYQILGWRYLSALWLVAYLVALWGLWSLATPDGRLSPPERGLAALYGIVAAATAGVALVVAGT